MTTIQKQQHEHQINQQGYLQMNGNMKNNTNLSINSNIKNNQYYRSIQQLNNINGHLDSNNLNNFHNNMINNVNNNVNNVNNNNNNLMNNGYNNTNSGNKNINNHSNSNHPNIPTIPAYTINPTLLQFSKNTRGSGLGIYQSNQQQQLQYSLTQKLSTLSQRLKNIHHFYRLRIQQQKQKSSQRNQIFMGIVQQLQQSHLLKISALEQQIQSAQQQKKNVNLVDDKMSSIKLSIDQILQQSNLYKSHNQKLQTQINLKQQRIKHKQKQAEKLKKQTMDYRNQLEMFERMKLKQNKKQREMLEMIGEVQNM